MLALFLAPVGVMTESDEISTCGRQGLISAQKKPAPPPPRCGWAGVVVAVCAVIKVMRDAHVTLLTDRDEGARLACSFLVCAPILGRGMLVSGGSRG